MKLGLQLSGQHNFWWQWAILYKYLHKKCDEAASETLIYRDTSSPSNTGSASLLLDQTLEMTDGKFIKNISQR